MKNQSKIRKSFIRSFLVLSLAAGTLLPLAVQANDDPQEGGRGKQAPRVTCTTTSYNILIATVVVTECSDGTRTVSLAA
ncbi:MAG: hypothetical protein M3367_07625 [Acidobacteriota bacterium]|nr:hypothetical protein [Acidobacteriota bacterium]